MLGFWSSIKLNNIPLCVYAPFCLCVCPAMIVWAASSTWSSWMMLPWTRVCKYLFESVLPVPLFIPRSGIVWHFWHYLQKCGHQFLMFLKTCHTVFHGGCVILHSHQQRTKVSVSPRPCKVLLFSHLLLIAILVDMKWRDGYSYCLHFFRWGTEADKLAQGHLAHMWQKQNLNLSPFSSGFDFPNMMPEGLVGSWKRTQEACGM